jgi:hypothetical protein
MLKKHKYYLLNIAIISVSTLVGLLIVEAILVFRGDYNYQLTRNLKPSNTIYKRYANTVEYRQHPDLKFDIPIIYDSFGIRNSQLSSPSSMQNVTGVFGDSFTENRRLPEEFSFTWLMNLFFENEKKNIYNFGVDGFGLEQSYQLYLNMAEKIDFEHIIYVFCENDLRNTYELRLFAFDADGNPVNRIDSGDIKIDLYSRKLVSSLAKLRITYLLIESWLVITGAYHASVQPFLNEKLLNKFSNNARKLHREKLADYMAMQIVPEIISDNISPTTLKVSEHFIKILLAFKNTVEQRGAKFTVAVLPREIDRKVARKVMTEEILKNTVFLQKFVEEDAVGGFSSRFKNDCHWNEFGNLAAAMTLIPFLSDKDTDSNLQGFFDLNKQRIIELYNLHSKSQHKLSEPFKYASESEYIRQKCAY